MDDLVKGARSALARAKLPGMSLIEHLEELRKRIIHSAVYLVIGFAVAYAFHERLYGFIQAPLDQLHIPLNFTHPTDGLTLYLKTSFVGGAILASPFFCFRFGFSSRLACTHMRNATSGLSCPLPSACSSQVPILGIAGFCRALSRYWF